MAYLFKHTLAPDDLRGQPDVPGADRERRGRPPRAARPEADALALPPLPPGSGDRRLEHELAAAAEAHPHPRGLREGLRRARRDHPASSASPTARPTRRRRSSKRFELDAEQTDAILELKLYRLARLEILVIQNELAEKRKRARQIGALLKDESGRWKLVRDELEEIQKKYGDPKIDPRRTRIEETEEVEYSADAFIVDEDNVVIVSRDGWVKRQKEVKDLSTTRLREGDSVLAALAGSTRATVVFFTNFGVAYTCRIVDVPASTGYGEPVQKLFKFKDGEQVIAAFSLDPRVAKKIEAKKEGDVPPVHAVAVTSDGYACASRCRRSSSRARARAAATRGPRRAPRW